MYSSQPDLSSISVAPAGQFSSTTTRARQVTIPPLHLGGVLLLPLNAQGLVLFAHGSGSSRHSPRNRAVAEALTERGIATLLFDLLTADEERDRTNVFDVALLARRLVDAIAWSTHQADLAKLPIGLFGASTGAAAALVAAAQLQTRISAVVSRGGRPDLAGDALEAVRAPTLLIVGGADMGVIELNESALARLRVPKRLQIVPGATHLFSEPGALDQVVEYAAAWFKQHFARADRSNEN